MKVARKLGARRPGIRWALLACVVLLPAAVFAVRQWNSPGDEAQIERTIRVVATTHAPSSCDEMMTVGYLEQTTDARPPFADDVCRRDAEAPGPRARSVDVGDIAVAGDSATALVANDGGSFDGSRLRVRLAKLDGHWRLDRLVAFTRFDRRRFEAAYRRQFAGYSSSPTAVRCAVRRTRALSDQRLEWVALHDLRPTFASIAVHCDRAEVERGLNRAASSPELGVPRSPVTCAGAKIKRSSPAQLARLQVDPLAYNELLWGCDREAVFDYLKRELSAYDDLDAAAVTCVLTRLRSLPPARAIRLTYDQPRYLRLIDACGQR